MDKEIRLVLGDLILDIMKVGGVCLLFRTGTNSRIALRKEKYVLSFDFNSV